MFKPFVRGVSVTIVLSCSLLLIHRKRSPFSLRRRLGVRLVYTHKLKFITTSKRGDFFTRVTDNRLCRRTMNLAVERKVRKRVPID